MRYSGPAGLTEQDDMENWNYATSASNGTIARRYPYNYQSGMGDDQPVPGVRGAFYASGQSEARARGLYKRWAEFMDAASWDDLYPVKK